MSLRYYANAPATDLSSSCTSSATSIVVTSVTGFPIQYPYTLILDRGESTEEAVSVTGASGTTLTVARGIDGTTAFAHAVGATVEHGITAQDVREPNLHIDSDTGVHGVTGALVGTTDAQTLTNKDLSDASNVFPSTLATDAEVASAASSAQSGAESTAAAALSAHEADTTTHGATGAVVGTTNAQTLSNKTLSSPTINNPTVTNLDLDGEGIGVWQSYTPDLRSSGAAHTLGNGTLTGKRARIGNLIFFRIRLSCGTTTAFAGGGQLRFTLPVNSTVPSNGSPQAVVRGPGDVQWGATYEAANVIGLVDPSGNDITGSTRSWTSGNVVDITGCYEAA